MPKPLESALEAVRRMSPGSEIDPALWREVLAEIAREAASRILPHTGPSDEKAGPT